jgi:hypothetical protein
MIVRIASSTQKFNIDVNNNNNNNNNKSPSNVRIVQFRRLRYEVQMGKKWKA